MPPDILDFAFSMRPLRVSSFLASSTQQIHSLRASGVISSHSLATFGVAEIIFRRSAGSLCTTPSESLVVISSSISLLAAFQNIARLTIKRLADSFQCGEADGFCLAVFEDGDVGHGDPDFFGKLGDAHLPFCEHHVYVDDDCHGYTVRSFSSFMRMALWRSFWRSPANTAMTSEANMITKPIRMTPGASSMSAAWNMYGRPSV
jgi:hypothetical protein